MIIGFLFFLENLNLNKRLFKYHYFKNFTLEIHLYKKISPRTEQLCIYKDERWGGGEMHIVFIIFQKVYQSLKGDKLILRELLKIERLFYITF